jgi:putative DNA primase/helicase
MKYPDFEYHQTDTGNAESFILMHGNDLLYSPETGEWLIWDGTRWSLDKLMAVHLRAKATVKAMYAELPNEPDHEKRKMLFRHITKSESERSLSAMVNLAKKHVAVSFTALDTHPHLWNCPNGTIDLRTGELLPHNREHLITKQCSFAYDPSATSEVWERFLDDCTGNDKEFQSFLQRAVGYSMYGDPLEHALCMIVGPGGTGKSTFINAILAVFGDYSTTADFSTFLKKDRVGSNGHSDDIASLAGKRLVVSVEVEEGQKIAAAMLKQLTGGDNVRASHKHGRSFEYKAQMTIWLVCNHAPIVSHDDDAMWRRLKRLPFEHKPEVQKKSLTAELIKAGSAILAWAVKGCAEWYMLQELKVPDIVQRATDQYKVKSNPLGDFVADTCLLQAPGFTGSAELRAAYDGWCREAGEKTPLNRNQFAGALRELGCTTGRDGLRGWIGISLKNDKNVYEAAKAAISTRAQASIEEVIQ